ncbi:MAG: hypothetical protein U0T69_03760 [Chitinophagales bacterium]
MILNFSLPILVIIGVIVSTLRVLDIFITDKQHKFVQDKMDSLAIFLDDLNPLNLLKIIFTEGFVSITLLIFYITLFLSLKDIAKAILIINLHPVVIISAVILMGFAFKKSLPFGKNARNWIISEINNNKSQVIKKFLIADIIVLLKSLAYILFYLLTSSAVGYSLINYLFNEKNLTKAIYFGFLTSTPFVFEFTIFLSLAILVLILVLGINLLSIGFKIINWFIWKIALYKQGKGALTAIIMITTFILSVLLVFK